MGVTPLEDDKKELKLGLIAQEVQEVLPEVVQTHNWEPISEDRPEEFHLVPMERLGMTYNEIVPVMIKAIQEQQAEIQEQQAENEALRARLDQLEELIKQLDK